MVQDYNPYYNKNRFLRIQARDRRSAAIHEAGHLIISWHLNYGADAWILPHDDVLDQCKKSLAKDMELPLDDNTWGGSCRTYFLYCKNPDDKFRVGVAGAIANFFFRDEDMGFLHDDMMLEDFFDTMSPTDKKTAYLKDFNEYKPEELFEIKKGLVETAELIQNLWPYIVTMSRILIDEWKNKERSKSEREKILQAMGSQ